MAANSKIEWCDHTFNPWTGCEKISPACANCYAEAWAKRAGHPERWQGKRERTSEANWRQPLKWDREAAAAGVRRRVFCASLADVFDNAVPDHWRSDLWDLIEQTPKLDWLLLTKRIGNALRMLRTTGWADRRNVWLGATICNQEEADRDIPKLLATPARVRFLSIEPMLGEIDLRSLNRGDLHFLDAFTGRTHIMHDGGMPNVPDLPAVDWVIVGGESGHHARPMHPAWVRSIRDQCAAAGVPFLFKQHGEWLPGEVYSRGTRGGFARHMDGSDGKWNGWPDHWWDGDAFDGVISTRVGKKAAGRLLDGVTHDAFPVRDHG